jgi:hypothetical protein
MSTERPYPPPAASERETLMAFLAFHRATLRMKCDGLTPEQLAERSGGPPSTMSLLGLVRHSRRSSATGSGAIAGEDAPPIYYSDEDPTATSPLTALTPMKRSHVAARVRCGDAMRAHSLDDVDT